MFTETEKFNEYSPFKLSPVNVKEELYICLQKNKSKSWKSFISEYIKNFMEYNSIQIGEEISVLIDEKKKRKKVRGKKQETHIVFQKYFTVNFVKYNKKREIQDNPLKGNTTRIQIANILSDKTDDWFADIIKTGRDNHEPDKINKDGRRVAEFKYKKTDYEVSNLQILWEIIYDITGYQAGNEKANIEMIKKKTRNHFDDSIISDAQSEELAKIKFDDNGMGNLSAKAIRKLLPLMSTEKYSSKYPLANKVKNQIEKIIELNQQEQNEIDDNLKLYSLKEFISDKKARIKLSRKMSPDEFKGLNFWEAAAVVYGNHSKVGITNIPADEIKNRMQNMQTVKPGSLNNPVVEKIVNETLKLVQLIYQTYGFDEMRIELSRELKASREEKEAIWQAMDNNRKQNDFAKKMLREMFNDEEKEDKDLSISKNNLDKIKIIEDVVANLKGKEHADKKKEFRINEPTNSDIKRYRHWLEQQFKCPYTNQSIPFSDVFSKTNKVEIEHIIPRERYRDNSYSNKVITWVEVNKAKAENGNRTAYEFIVSKRDREKVAVSGKGDLDLAPSQDWEEHVNKMFTGRKAKNLLRKGIPEDPINRELKETQYINKKLREKLGEVIGFDKVWTSTGQITDMLRNAWHLNDKVMHELLRNRYEKFKPPMGQGTTIESIPDYNLIYDNRIFDKKTGEEKIRKEFPNFSKRLDHRHHALDAIIVACTTQMHIQSINTLNAQYKIKHYNGNDEEKKAQKIKYKAIDEIIMRLNEEGKPTFKEPWETEKFVPQVRDALSKIIVSHKNSNVLTSPSKNKKIASNNYTVISIRQKLHAETFVGKRKICNDKKTAIEEIINLILLEREKSKKEFPRIIKNIVFKEKFQNQLISLFEKYTALENTNELKFKILEKIKSKKNEYFSFATTFDVKPVKRGSETVTSIKVKNVIDKRTKRYLSYRQDWIEEVEKEWKKIKNEKDSQKKKEVENKRNLVKNYTDFPIYYNALYDVRLKDGNWKPLFEFDKSMVDEVQYIKYRKGEKKTNNKRTEQVKRIISNYQYEFNKENILLMNPIFIPNAENGVKKIVIKKATVENWVGEDALIEIRPKTFVSPIGKFRALVTESADGIKNFQFINHLEALQYQKLEKDFLQAEIKIPKSLIPDGDRLLFTLTKNDFIIIPKNKGDEANWNNISDLSNMLYRVLDFDETGYIRFVKHTIADKIKLNDIFDAEGIRRTLIEMQADLVKENDEYSKEEKRIKSVKEIHEVWKKSLSKEESEFHKDEIKKKELEIKEDEKSLKQHKKEINDKEKEAMKLKKAIEFKSKEDKPALPIEETIELKSKDEMQKIIKVFTDKLGKKIIPYWKFPNGAWDKKTAKELDLIR